MNCAFTFLLVIIEKHDWLNHLFKFKVIFKHTVMLVIFNYIKIKIQHTCEYCASTIVRQTNSLNINLSKIKNVKSISFSNLFDQTKFIWERSPCNHNNFNEQITYNFHENKYLLIKINSKSISRSDDGTLQEEYLDTKILNFNVDLVKIPNSDFCFRLLGSINYYPSSKHYTCTLRIRNKWLEISDSTSHFWSKFELENLDQCYILMLEKI